MDWELEEMGRANGWPCVVSSIWREPGFCPDYASDSCPFYSKPQSTTPDSLNRTWVNALFAHDV